MPRSWSTLIRDFAEDMYALRSVGYTTKQQYADRLGITLVNFNQRMCRARKAGYLPKPGPGFCNEFRPFGEPCNCFTYDGLIDKKPRKHRQRVS